VASWPDATDDAVPVRLTLTWRELGTICPGREEANAGGRKELQA
jgi:hypothetical protein